ncbi:MAG: tetratricopeptide repeat protein [Spirochaetaceae bacterium]|nr:MAG: tetratricopeptide repeat protein [Spirochaetaceae bacterium]
MKAMTVHESLTRARKAYRIGDYILAEKMLLNAIERNPRMSLVYNFLGSVYDKLGNYEQAIRQIKQAIKLKQDFTEAYNNLGVVLRKIDRYDEAIVAFRQALSLAPQRADIHYNLGNVYKSLGQDSKAREEFSKALKLEPRFVPAYNNLGTVLERQNRFEEAIATYRRGLEQDFNQPNLHYNLGIALQKQGNLQEAQSEFEQALKVRPGWVEAMNNLGVILQTQGKNNEALQVFQEILKFDPDNLQALNNLGVVYGQLGMNDEAVRHYREALKIDPSYFSAVSNLGALLENRGQFSEALEEFSRLVDLDPDNLEGRVRLASTYFYLERFKEAAALLIDILKRTPNHGPSLRTLAKVYQRSGNDQQAEQLYRRLLEVEPENKEFHLDIAEVAKEKGDMQTAERELRTYLDSVPEDSKARLLLGELYLQQNRYKHASQVFKDILADHPDHVEAHELLAATYRKMGNPTGALETLEKVMTLEGTRADSADLDKLRITLDTYEDTISEFASPLRAELNENIEKLKNLRRKVTAEEDQEPALDYESLAKQEQSMKQLDAVPIIHFGGQEPAIKIEEEVEAIDLDEMEETLEPSRIEIEDRTPESLMSLLDNQKLYNENPAWKDFQLPPSFTERPRQMPRPEPPQFREAEPPSVSQPSEYQPSRAEAEEALDRMAADRAPRQPSAESREAVSPGLGQPLSEPVPPTSRQEQQSFSAAQELLSQSLRESMRAQAQMMDRLTQEMGELYARTASRSQFMPMQPSLQEPAPHAFPRYQPPSQAFPPLGPSAPLEEPVVPPPLEATEGIPRFARDFVAEEEQVEPLVLEGAPGTGEPAYAGGRGAAGMETPATPEARLEGSREQKAKPGEEKKDLRQRLRDFLKRIRERLEQRRSKQDQGVAAVKPTAGPKRSKKPKVKNGGKVQGPSSPPVAPSASLVNYLEELTEYLPERRKSSFLHSDARLKIEYIKSKLQGRSGIKKNIESRFVPRADQAVSGSAGSTVDRSASSAPMDMGKIAETFDFMKNLASYHPDKTLGTMLQSKLNGILHKIRK